MLRMKPTNCIKCGYSLAAHEPGDKCPECGVVIEYKLVPDPLGPKSRFIDNPEKLTMPILIFLIISVPFFLVVLLIVLEEIEYLIENLPYSQ